jgi:fumarate reductase flavoprotein subunit
MQLRQNIKFTRDEGFKELMNYSHGKANAALVRTIVNKSGDTISWLENHGVQFALPGADFLGGPRVWRLLKGFGAI